MEIQYLFTVLKRKWWLIAVTILITVNLSLFNSYYWTEMRYEAVASFIVSPNIQNIAIGKDIVNSLEALDKRSIVATYAEIIDTRQIFNGTLEFLGSDPLDYRDYKTSTVVLPDASILQFTVQGPDPEVAAALANGIGHYAIDFINNLYPVYNLSFIDRAVTPNSPYQPRVTQNALLALIIGAALGVSLVILQSQLSSTLDGLIQRRKIDSESLSFSHESFERQMREEIARQPNGEFTMGFVYLSGIQEFYNSLPQRYGNEIMRKVSGILQLHLRGNDIVGRWSKLQFSFLLPSTNGDSAVMLMARIQETLAQPFSLDAGNEYLISLAPTIGLAYRQWGESFQVLVDQAEQALEVARESETRIELYTIRPLA